MAANNLNRMDSDSSPQKATVGEILFPQTSANTRPYLPSAPAPFPMTTTANLTSRVLIAKMHLYRYCHYDTTKKEDCQDVFGTSGPLFYLVTEKYNLKPDQLS